MRVSDAAHANHGDLPDAERARATEYALMASLAPPPNAPLRLASGRTGLRAAASRKAAGLVEGLLAHAQPGGETEDAIAGARFQLPKLDARTAPVVGVLLVVAAVVFITRGPGGELADAFDRAASADWRWAALGVVFEALAFAGYASLFWHVAGREAKGLDLRSSAEISLAGAAATRVLPTAGLGGIALTLWSLARRGVAPASAVRALLTFLILVYTVFMGALAAAGIALVTGAADGSGPVPLIVGPAAFGLVVIVAALVLSRGSGLFAQSVRGAIGFARGGDARLLGALAWWGFDMAVLVASPGKRVTWRVADGVSPPSSCTTAARSGARPC
jgi:hypothetical protein